MSATEDGPRAAATPETDDAAAEPAGGRDGLPGWIDMALAIILALAAVGTAWAGFQSSKWTGVQANTYAQASATRTESNRESTEAGQLMTIDVITFTQWLTALNQEVAGDPSKLPQGSYTPDPATVSGFLFNRFRAEFKPAVLAWIATRPLLDPQAPPTPFAMSEYHLAAQTRATQLENEAEQGAATARQANQRSDNYVLTAVLFALVLFFAALTGRTRGRRAQLVLFGLSVVTLIGAAATLITYPVEI